MADNTRTSLWVAGTAVVAGFLGWAFSFGGAVFATTLVSASLPGWLWPLERGSLLAWEAIALPIAFLLTLLCVRRFSAPPQLWLGALAASLLLAGKYLIGLAELSRLHVHGGMHDVLYDQPFLDPVVALLALVGLPLVAGLGCWLASRRRAAQVAVPGANGVSHA